MGLFDQLSTQVTGPLTGSGGESSSMVNAVLQMLGTGQSGGLAGLVQSFQQKGLGSVVSSWVGTGENLPISAEQIQDGLGAEKIQQFASTAGVSPEIASSKLAEFLPGIVDKLTPGGKLPEGGLLEQGLSFLKSKV